MKLYGLNPLVPIDYEDLEREVLLGERDYREMIERGKMVYTIIGKGNISEERLSKHNKIAMDAYIKQTPPRF